MKFQNPIDKEIIDDDDGEVWCDVRGAWVNEDECCVHPDLCDDNSCDSRPTCQCYQSLCEMAG